MHRDRWGEADRLAGQRLVVLHRLSEEECVPLQQGYVTSPNI